MFFIPNGIWCGAPCGAGYYIWKSLIPTLLGNLVGGGLFVSTIYWYLYLTGEGSVQVDFNMGGIDSAMGGGGPMKKGSGTKHSADVEDMQTIIGQTPRQMISALGHDLSDASPYAKTHAERTKGSDSDSQVKADEKV